MVYLLSHKLSNSEWPLLSPHLFVYSNKEMAERECKKTNRKGAYIREIEHDELLRKLEKWKYIGYEDVIWDCRYDEDVNLYIKSHPNLVIRNNVSGYNGTALMYYSILAAQFKADRMIESYNKYFKWLLSIYKETFFCVPILPNEINHNGNIPISYRVYDNRESLPKIIGTEGLTIDMKDDGTADSKRIKKYTSNGCVYIPATIEYDKLQKIIGTSDEIGICNEADLFFRVGGLFGGSDVEVIKIYLGGGLTLHRTANGLKIMFE